MAKEIFEFTGALKKKLYIVAIVGFALLMIGGLLSGGEHESEENASEMSTAEDVDHSTEAGQEDHAEVGGHGEEASAEHGGGWFKRVKIDLWINNVYFTGLALIGIFFFALQYVSQAGWSTYIIRIPLSMAQWLPYAFALMLVTFALFGHDIFHWTHSELYDKASAEYDYLIDGKNAFFFWPLDGGTLPVFFILRMVIFFGVWYWLLNKMKSLSIAEDEMGGDSYWHKIRKFSAIFLVFFAVTSSIASWDWVMSIDTHWFSTLFGWYVFASWWVSGLAFITLSIVILKEMGYLVQVTSNHLHDLGKLIFAFSIFWTYIWFSQFLLIYYANIPEESVYFVERMMNDKYAPLFFINLIMNFFFPLLILMTRDAKRLNVFLKIACIIVLIGHWLDFYLMATPGTLGDEGAFGLTEIGMFLIFGSAFVFVTLNALTKYSLVPKNHPMLEEAKNHHI
jgi:hypothetical protein